MKNVFFIICFTLLSYSAFSQYGIRLGYNINNFDQWSKYEDNIGVEYHPSQLEVGLNYWFRLKNNRVEFLPELVYGLPSEVNLPYLTDNYNEKFSYLDLKVNTQFYLFDFKEDCDCPTFSKQGPAVIKGFFIYVSPGARYSTRNISVDAQEDITNNNLSFILSAGAGYDIGITDIFTVTPYFGVNMIMGDENNYVISENLGIEKDTWNSYNMGVRMTVRFDYLSKPSWQR